MKATRKPMSSPGRADKLPTPLLMRFLRSNVSSRSRGGGGRSSRSTSAAATMLIIRRKNAAAIHESTQEPSSPKVTCMGQVRASRRQTRTNRRSDATLPNRHFHCLCPSISCRWVRRAFHKLPKWVLFFRFGYCSTVELNPRSVDVEANDDIQEKDEYHERASAGVGESEEVFLASTPTPPKNALLLTRCRSAPYRSSSLASRFWGSPLSTSETADCEEDEAMKLKGLQKQREKINLDRFPTLESDPIPICTHAISEDVKTEENEETSAISKELMKVMVGGSVHPLMLTRCKSEPARTRERLNLEANFWRQTRLHLFTGAACSHT